MTEPRMVDVDKPLASERLRTLPDEAHVIITVGRLRAYEEVCEAIDDIQVIPVNSGATREQIVRLYASLEGVERLRPSKEDEDDAPTDDEQVTLHRKRIEAVIDAMLPTWQGAAWLVCSRLLGHKKPCERCGEQ